MLGMGQKRKEDKPEDGCPICSHARTKVWFREKRSSNVQTQTFNSPRGSNCSEEVSCPHDTGVYHCSSSKWHDEAAARCHQTDSAVEQSGYHEHNETRSCPNPNRNPNQLAKCQKCDYSRSSAGSRPPSSSSATLPHPEKKIYLHLNMRNRDSPQLVICPKRNHHHGPRHSASRGLASNSRDTVIDVDSLSLPLPSRPWSRMSEPAAPLSMAFCKAPIRTPRDSPHDSVQQLQSLRQAYGSSSKERAPSPAASTRAQPHNVDRPQAPRPSGPPQRRPPSIATPEEGIAKDGDVDETLLPVPKWPHGQQQTLSTVASQISTPRVVDRAVLEPDSSSSTLAALVSSTRRSTKITKDHHPMRVKGGSGTQLAEEGPVESSTAQIEGVVLSWESLTVTSK